MNLKILLVFWNGIDQKDNEKPATSEDPNFAFEKTYDLVFSVDTNITLPASENFAVADEFLWSFQIVQL